MGRIINERERRHRSESKVRCQVAFTSSANLFSAREHALKQNPTTRSQRPGRNWLDARVYGVSGQPLPQFLRRFVVAKEASAYDALVRDGGRPLYPIDLLERVSRDPEEYREILLPWQDPPDLRSPWEVFQRQWQRWKAFRIHQQENRGIHGQGLSAYVKSFRQWAKAHMTREGLATIDADPSYFHEKWASAQRKRQLFRDGNGFADYERTMRRRLARHGFDRPFKLMEDPIEQDNLTTWIEYLNFEYWWLDGYATEQHYWQGPASQDRENADIDHLGDPESGSTKRRRDLITNLLRRSFAKADMTQQAGLISWVLEQVTLIEIKAEEGCPLVVKDCIIVALEAPENRCPDTNPQGIGKGSLAKEPQGPARGHERLRLPSGKRRGRRSRGRLASRKSGGRR